MAERFIQLLKRERICRQIHSPRDAAEAKVFNYIEMFCTQSGATALPEILRR